RTRDRGDRSGTRREGRDVERVGADFSGRTAADHDVVRSASIQRDGVLDERVRVARGAVVVLGHQRAGVRVEIQDAIDGQARVYHGRVLGDGQHRALGQLNARDVIVVRSRRAVGAVRRRQRVVYRYTAGNPDLPAPVHGRGPRLRRHRVGARGELVVRIRADDVAAAGENDVELRVLDLPQRDVVIESEQ